MRVCIEGKKEVKFRKKKRTRIPLRRIISQIEMEEYLKFNYITFNIIYKQKVCFFEFVRENLECSNSNMHLNLNVVSTYFLKFNSELLLCCYFPR